MTRAIVVFVTIVVTTASVAAIQLASQPADQWIARLERPERTEKLKVDEVLARLDLQPGAIVADVGAGAGVFSMPLARAVGPTGKVYAVEVDRRFLEHIERRAREQRVGNVETVLGKFEDPALPVRNVDLLFFHDVLHHIAERAAYVKAAAGYLKPTGRVAIIELGLNGSHRDDPSLQVSTAQVRDWMAAAGLRPLREFALFEDKWFVIYGR